MPELLEILAKWLGFFFEGDRYRIAHSQVGPSHGDALLELVSDRLAWRLIRDRSQVFLDCRPGRSKGASADWYSTDVIARLLTGQRQESAVLSEEVATWVHQNLAEIEGRFSPEQLEDTRRALKSLERLRAKEMFG